VNDLWVIKFKAEGPGPDAATRVRNLLKIALRSIGLRAVSVAIAAEEPGAAGRPSGRGRSRKRASGDENASGGEIGCA
jgi:hypothetical protein